MSNGDMKGESDDVKRGNETGMVEYFVSVVSGC